MDRRTESAARDGALRRLHVLVAETDRNLLSVLGWVLAEDARFHVVALAGMADEVATCPDDFDLALVDLHLAGADGLDLIPRLRLRVPPPVVVVMADDGPVYLRHAALAAGAAGYLIRPDDLDRLGDRLLEVVTGLPPETLDARMA